MEDVQKRDNQKVGQMQEKYKLGHSNKGGAAYNIVNLDYERSADGEFLKEKDNDAHVRQLLRSKNIDSLANNGYNLLNGDIRRTVDVPTHGRYNAPGSQGSALGNAGAAVFGGGFAGRPLRGMDKEFGKRINNQGTDDGMGG